MKAETIFIVLMLVIASTSFYLVVSKNKENDEFLAGCEETDMYVLGNKSKLTRVYECK